jgi:hypothetical protein
MSYLKLGKYYGAGSLDEYDKYQIKEELDDDYSDISCVQVWLEVGESLGLDYLKRRERAKEYVSTVKFETLSDYEKKLACQEYLVSKIDRDTIYTEEEQYEYWKNFIKKHTLFI